MANLNKVKLFLKYILTKYTIILYFFSAVLLLGAKLLPEESLSKSISEILLIIGSGIFITTFVTSILNFYFHEDINRYFSIIRSAEKSGILRLYSNRKEAIKIINLEFERARGKIDLLAIAGTDFFHSGCKIIKELDNMCVHDSNYIVRILLLDPCSKHAIDRALIEDGFNDTPDNPIDNFNYLHSTLWSDIITSMNMLERILEYQGINQKNNFKLEIRTYNTAPMLLYVLVNDRAFVEQYHYGITNEERSTSLTRCIGKKVSVLEFRSSSIAGQLWNSHFDYLWETSANGKISQGYSEKLPEIMKSKNLASIYKQG